jgi:CspA family cold shock protein
VQTGIVKWFNNAKGFGFILPDEGEGDVFVHYSSIEMEGYRTLKAGQLVAFDTIQGPKGLHATKIESLSKTPTMIGESETYTKEERTTSTIL